MTSSPRVIALSTAIGRGHPHYLDCVVQILRQRLSPEDFRFTTVFELSHGLARLGWNAVRFLYRASARNQPFIDAYTGMRRGQVDRPPNRSLGLLARDLRKAFADFRGILLVEHQLTARMLAGVCRTWYLHADVAAPPECVIRPDAAAGRPERVFVPLEFTEQGFLNCGADPAQLVRTGLMIEPELVPLAHDAFHQRLTRLSGNSRLTVAFFSSGAAPEPHVRKIILGGDSVLRQGMTAVVACGTDYALWQRMIRTQPRWRVKAVLDDGEIPVPPLGAPEIPDFGMGTTDGHRQTPTGGSESGVGVGRCASVVESGKNRESANPQSASLRLVFRRTRAAENEWAVRNLAQIDAFVAPAHERVNWALGLGIPFFALFPMIGTHAPQNYDFCFSQNVAYPIRTDDDARTLGPALERLHADGALANMARCGFGRFPIDGAERTADAILAGITGTGS